MNVNFLLIFFLLDQVHSQKKNNLKAFNQVIDHFNIRNGTKFYQRYLFDNSFYDLQTKSGPLIVYINGHNSLEGTKLKNTLIYELANHTKGLILALEHRFFGESQPFLKLSNENLQYLTIEQTLADINSFLIYCRKQYCNLPNCSIILIGNSYGGTLATWYRLKYPNFANFSWISSAPLNNQQTFPEFDKRVTEILKSINHNCYLNTKRLFDKYETILSNGNATQKNELYQKYGITSQTSSVSFLSIIYTLLSKSIENNYVFQQIDSYCDKSLNNEKVEEAFLNLYYYVFNKLNISSESLDIYQLTNEDPYSQYASSRASFYLSCNQLGWFRTSNGFISSKLNLDYYNNACQNLFNIQLSEITSSKMNSRYGARYPGITYSIFTYGELDPWSELSASFSSPSQMNYDQNELNNKFSSFENNYNNFLNGKLFNVSNFSNFENQYPFNETKPMSEIIQIWIPNGSSSNDLYSFSNNDSESLLTIKKIILSILEEWILNPCSNWCKHGFCILEQCRCEFDYSGNFCDEEVVPSEMFWIIGISTVLIPIMIIIIVGGSAWWVFRKIEEDQFLQTLQF